MKSLRFRLGQITSFLIKRRWCRISKPVLVYQMGKVASSSVYLSLEKTTDFDVFHVHRLNPENIAKVREEHVQRGDSPPNEKKGLYLYENLIRTRKTHTKIISLVREPIARNISAFFQNLQLFERVKKSTQEEGANASLH